MQNDAIRRVEDMQKRARQTAGIEKQEELPPSQPDTVRRIPQPSGYLNKPTANSHNTQPPASLSNDNIIEKIKNGIGELNIDSDKALLLSLIMLLSEENADELLIMALIYMLN